MPSVGEGFNVAATASTHDEEGVRFTQDASVHRRMVEALVAKIYNHTEDIVEAECHNIDHCDIGLVSFGCTSRAAYEAVERAEGSGIRVGHVRLKTVWPFPDERGRTAGQERPKDSRPGDEHGTGRGRGSEGCWRHEGCEAKQDWRRRAHHAGRDS